MINERKLRKVILRLRRIRAPYIIVDATETQFAQELEVVVLDICSKLGLMIYIDRQKQHLRIRNLFFSNN